ncbi:histidine decarboxylase [Francisella orientalis]|uniref:Histidine decarboxylase n=1 Tax=Francisella orientalis TaxID=299583 RepID=A0AAP6XBI2_9GAMM|nr:histidine decarboxylase [Francisella orientalis]AFJ44038.1 histidine decarboxylase [Francisella orientalis str. Toba 04]AHB98558.1 hypothetical protein M973_06615 [Francisella orientalis LADL 07-285A]AKN85790.1 Histidine decarboxylase [Francisella orientalis FNO12]AKN87329.1 Histidine decarboxylase [Francisella orientalis FNO24]AKN88866.1 Histidine decarboxylase [Francisella orientalis]
MKYIDRLKHNTELYIGYPPATDFKLSQYAELLDYSMNSLGNPYDLNNPFSSHAHEKSVIDFFINLYKLDHKNFWGYVANCSSESIMYCLWRAKKHLQMTNNQKVKIICNEFSHYAIDKTADILDLELIKIQSNEYGEIDYNALKSNIKSEYNYIFFATIGSTITSSIDDINIVKNILEESKTSFYIHADAAFNGAFIPFTDDFHKCQNFDSINISGHKFIGLPIPCGITIINKEYISGRYIEYTSNNDVTIGGSRNGLTPYLLYKRIKELNSADGLKNRFNKCLKLAKNYQKILEENNINVFRNNNSLTLALTDIPKEIMKKWHAPTRKRLTTITALPKLTEEKLRLFIADIKNHNENRFVTDTITIMPSNVATL